MEVNVYNIKGEDTGRKITLNESIFGIEPNDHAEALTKVGLLGVKVWICRGEVFGKKELAPNFTQSKEGGRGNAGSRDGGKNFKRKKNNR